MLLGGLVVATDRGVWVAVTGAPCAVDRRRAARRVRCGGVAAGAAASPAAGPPESGLRTYVAVAGGIAVEPVLGSRSTDTLGAGRAAAGRRRRRAAGRCASTGARGRSTPRGRRSPVRCGCVPGPRADRVAGDVLDLLCRTAYAVSPDSDRIGLRLVGDPLPLARTDELPSEGIVLGAVQVPPDGRPVVFLADHPTTGGYPVVGGRRRARPVAVRAAAAGGARCVHAGRHALSAGSSAGSERTGPGGVSAVSNRTVTMPRPAPHTQPRP